MPENNHHSVAQRLVEELARQNLKIVLAESCTGGMAAALLAGVPGVSNYLCGSAVTYRVDTKSQWLGVSADFIEAHTAESPETSLAMAIGILERTPEAEIAAAITGHLGPGAPPEKDGVVHIGIASRTGEGQKTAWESFTLESTGRVQRQQEAVEAMLSYVLSCM